MRSSDHKHGGVYTRELGEKCEIKLDSIQRNRSVAIRVGCPDQEEEKEELFSRIFTRKSELDNYYRLLADYSFDLQ